MTNLQLSLSRPSLRQTCFQVVVPSLSLSVPGVVSGQLQVRARTILCQGCPLTVSIQRVEAASSGMTQSMVVLRKARPLSLFPSVMMIPGLSVRILQSMCRLLGIC